MTHPFSPGHLRVGLKTQIAIGMVDKTQRLAPLADSALLNNTGALVLCQGGETIEVVAAGQWQRVYLAEKAPQSDQK